MSIRRSEPKRQDASDDEPALARRTANSRPKTSQHSLDEQPTLTRRTANIHMMKRQHSPDEESEVWRGNSDCGFKIDLETLCLIKR